MAMTLNRQSNVLSFLAVCALVIVLLIIGMSALNVRERTEQMADAEKIVAAVTNFRYLILETVLYRENRSAIQWQNRTKSFNALLESSKYSTPRAKALLTKEKENVVIIQKLYRSLLGLNAATPLGGKTNILIEDRTLGTVSALFLTTQDMLDDAFELIQLNRQGLIQSQDRAANSVLASVLLLSGLIGTCAYLIKRRVLVPIVHLQNIIGDVAQGNLAVRATLYRSDELGRLARSFNDMTQSLEVSRLQLEAESTERLHAQTALQETVGDLATARDAAQAASEAKSQFLANMSHEIRTPMNAVQGMLQLLHYTALTTLQRDYVANAQIAAKSLLGLLNDILDFSKIDAQKMILESAPVLIDELLRDLSAILSANVGSKNVELLFSIDPALPDSFLGDAHRLRQILLNLTGNAIKFTQQGEVIVSLMLVSHTDVPAIRFEVADSGIGMPADKLTAIFEGFTQAEASTTRRFGGTGLGLAICRRLVELMGGILGVESQLGKGSKFYFTLPLPDPSNAIVEMTTAPPARALRVLVVDDNDHARNILLSFVRTLHWEGHGVASGEEALNKFQQSESDQLPYDAVLVDWRMPHMDGWEVSRRIRTLPQGATAPIIIMVTAHERSALNARIVDGDNLLNGFISKPVTAPMIADAVLDALAGLPLHAVCPSDGVGNAMLHGLKLLVIDDNLMNQRVASELLKAQGAEVQVASGGIAGRAKAINANPPFDAILMDIQMPDMDGYDTTRALRLDAGMESMPIIAMTANVMATDKALCLKAGMTDHIGKPLNLQVMVETILKYCIADPSVMNSITLPPKVAALVPPPTAGEALLDLEAARARLGGNHQLFDSIACKFGDEARVALANFHGCMTQHDYAGAADALHTLRGTAGLIGAIQLQHFLSGFEKTIRFAQTGSNFATESKALIDLVARSEEALKLALLPGIPRDEAEVHLPDQRGTEEALAEIVRLLEQSNMRAVSAFASYIKHRSHHNIDAQAVSGASEAIGRLDFNTALQFVHRLQASH